MLQHSWTLLPFAYLKISPPSSESSPSLTCIIGIHGLDALSYLLFFFWIFHGAMIWTGTFVRVPEATLLYVYTLSIFVVFRDGWN